MKKFFPAVGLFALTFFLAGCSTAPSPQGADAVAAATDTLIPTGAADKATATEAPTATETPPPNLIHLGALELVPFAPPWFDGDLAAVVFTENGFLRIDSPLVDYEQPGRNHVTGAVILTTYDGFDISATFNTEGGVCRGVDYNCGNIFVSNCIVFDYLDFDNMQKFCINASALFWYMIAFENGAVVYHSSAQPSEAIQDNGVIYYDEHPIPNEMRVTYQNGVLTGSINGETVFERDEAGINGKIGVGCINNNSDPQWSLANCEATLVVNPQRK